MGDVAIGARSGSGGPLEPDGTGGQGGFAASSGEGEGGTTPGGRPEAPGARAAAGDGAWPEAGQAPGTAAGGADAVSGGAGPQGAHPGDAAPAPEGGAEATSDGEAAPKRKQRSFWVELPFLVVIALALALVIKTFLVQAFVIPSASMEDTLQIEDRVLVDKLTPWFGSEPERGEVVVFRDPGQWLGPAPAASDNPVVRFFTFIGLMPDANEQNLIKRVIGVGGDTIECQGTGPVMVNGEPLDEPYLKPGVTPCGDRSFGPVTVPEGSIWVMGDNRSNSEDSRYHQNENGGFVPVDDVVGRALVIAWPVGHWDYLEVPETYAQFG
ncbi:signal peptidase I [Allostreptomyces psammosilenae]|uniref:Signal peptidase I n=1 Tax=Allostreptomyces psammosilenae TaxID=1892865 RepID=A0A853AD92_9ACTN|nr:signal peptidase I [Allostreptomyces psammosilenae]NYI08408.1 signal peptidase I [Allostreptomyces psammosilenae]